MERLSKFYSFMCVHSYDYIIQPDLMEEIKKIYLSHPNMSDEKLEKLVDLARKLEFPYTLRMLRMKLLQHIQFNYLKLDPLYWSMLHDEVLGFQQSELSFEDYIRSDINDNKLDLDINDWIDSVESISQTEKIYGFHLYRPVRFILGPDYNCNILRNGFDITYGRHKLQFKFLTHCGSIMYEKRTLGT